MSTSKSTAQQIAEIEEKRKKLARQLQDLKRKEEQRHSVIYRRIGKIIIEDYSTLTVDEVPDNDEGAAEFVAHFLSDVATQDDLKDVDRIVREHIEQVVREYLANHEFGRLHSDENGENCAEPFALSDLLVRDDDGRYYTIDLPAEIANVFTKAPQAT